ncbi:hypothetical protein MMC14_010657 [Varicellaria rhodocarpa]|nr:hypothetical protein [Varicellaria rhodocarpa]
MQQLREPGGAARSAQVLKDEGPARSMTHSHSKPIVRTVTSTNALDSITCTIADEPNGMRCDHELRSGSFFRRSEGAVAQSDLDRPETLPSGTSQVTRSEVCAWTTEDGSGPGPVTRHSRHALTDGPSSGTSQKAWGGQK